MRLRLAGIKIWVILSLPLLLLVVGCGQSPEPVFEIPALPTLAVAARAGEPEPTATNNSFLPPTFTPDAQLIIVPTDVGQFVYTPIPTNTPFPTLVPTVTRTPRPTRTPIPPPAPLATATPIPTATSLSTSVPIFVPTSAVTQVAPSASENILFNPSFEGGHYNQKGIAELQLPNNWGLEWDEGRTGFGSEVWDQWYRPEVRVLSKSNLPASEHGIFIKDGDFTLKVFKESGPASFRLSQAHQLEAGKYRFTVNAFADMVDSYNGTTKVYAPDPFSAELAFLINGQQDAWKVVEIGKMSQFSTEFTLSQPETVNVAVAARGRFAVQNNGWFFDNFSLVKIE